MVRRLRHKLFITIAFLNFYSLCVTAQQIWSVPTYPVANDAVSVYFDINQCDCNLTGYSGDLYAHTGIILAGDGSWKNVIGNWGNNSTQPKLIVEGSGIYRLDIQPSIKEFYNLNSGTIEKMAFVFRSADGNKQSADLFLHVFETGGLSLLSPTLGSIFTVGQDISVHAVNISADSLKLYFDNQIVTTVYATELLENISPSQAGFSEVKVVSFAGNDIAEENVHVLVRNDSPIISDAPSHVHNGVTISSDTVYLRLTAPGKDFVFVKGDFNDWTLGLEDEMKRSVDGTYFWTYLTGLNLDIEYAYQYVLSDGIVIADPYTEKVLDPQNDKYIPASVYPNLKPYPTGKASEIVSVFESNQEHYNWKIQNFEKPEKEKLIIYELLTREFLSSHSFSEIIDTLDYIQNLGVNAIEFMPVNEFEGNSSWGYNSSFHFALDKYYGTKNDFKALVDACHERGIAVLFDLVINHVYGQSPLVRMYWNAGASRPAADSPWFNEESPNQVYSFGYDFNHESPFTRSYFKDVLRYWVEEYHIDGYRFDFTKGLTNRPGEGSGHDDSRIAILEDYADYLWSVDPRSILILEHFAANTEEKILANYGMLLWSNFNYAFSQVAMGYISGSSLSNMSYVTRGFDKAHAVHYMESHDEERQLYKTLTYGKSNGEYDTRELDTAIERAKMAATLFFAVPGPKMFWMFGELGYDVSIDNPCRVCEKPIRWQYYQQEGRKSLYDHYSNLIKIRQDHAIFNTADFTIAGNGLIKTVQLMSNTENVLVIGNMDVAVQEVTLNFPHNGTWYEYYGQYKIEINDENLSIELQPGQYQMYTDTPYLDDYKNGPPSSTIDGVYPNPGFGLISWKMEDITKIELFDEMGRYIRQSSITENTIDLQDLQSGVYFFNFTNSQNENHWYKYIKL